MRILVSIDDTDDADSKGTGEIAEIIAEALTGAGLATTGRVTRHQLLIHPDIAYTSHNSSMCFEADIAEDALDDVIALSAQTLAAESVAAADPGLAVVVPERLARRPSDSWTSGSRRRSSVLTKDDAYSLAEELGVHLSEHGGTGIGVIGALAGAGLKMTGNDGRFKGKFRLNADEQRVADVAHIKHQDIDEVRTLDERDSRRRGARGRGRGLQAHPARRDGDPDGQAQRTRSRGAVDRCGSQGPAELLTRHGTSHRHRVWTGLRRQRRRTPSPWPPPRRSRATARPFRSTTMTSATSRATSPTASTAEHADGQRGGFSCMKELLRG